MSGRPDRRSWCENREVKHPGRPTISRKLPAQARCAAQLHLPKRHQPLSRELRVNHVIRFGKQFLSAAEEAVLVLPEGVDSGLKWELAAVRQGSAGSDKSN